MAKNKGHMVQGFIPGQSYPIGQWSDTATAEKWVTDSRTLPVGTVVQFSIRGVAGTTAYTKASQT